MSVSCSGHLMTRRIYEKERQQTALMEAIKQAWSEISLDYLKPLYDSLPNSMGGRIKYKTYHENQDLYKSTTTI